MELNQITVVNHPHPILPAADVKVAAHDWQGQTVREMLLSYGYDDQQEIVIFLNDRLLTVEEWDTVCPSPGDIVNVKAVVSGGDGSNPLMVVLMIAVMVLSAGAGTAAAAAAEAAAAGTGAAAGALASATVMVAGTLLINAMFKPSTPKGGGSSEQTYSLSGGSNSIRRYDPLPVIFGTHIFYPDYGALPYVENKGQDQYLNQMLNLGLSNCIYTDWKIGDTLLSRYRNVKTSWGPNGQAIYGFPGNVDTVQGAEIDTSTGWVTRTTSADTSAIAVDIEGVAYYGDKEDGLLKVVVELEVQYSPAGAGTWQTMVSHDEQVYHPYYWSLQITNTDSEGSSYTYQVSYDRGDAQHVEGERQPYPLYSSENTTFWVTGTWHYIPLNNYHSYPNPGGYYTPITVNTLEIAHIATQTLKRSTVKINVAPGQYDVRVRMLSAREEHPYRVHNLVKSGELEGYSYHWTYLRSYQTDTATYEGQTRLGLTIKASGQLNGTLDRISCIASAYCYVFDGTSWSWATTSNPAWWFLDFARGRYSSTGKKLYGCFLPDSQIDLATIKVWATFCDAEGLTFNYVLSQQESSWDTLVRIARCGLGSPSWASGKLGVVWDAKNQSPVAAFGMSNIIKGTFEVAYVTENLADEIVVNYADASDGYEVKQVRVTVPGVTTPNNPTETALEGCTNATMAGKYANVLAAQQYYRRRQITWESDFEGFVCQRGDVVLLQHDLTQWGYSGRLVDVVGDTLTLDRTVEREGTPEYCMIVEPDGTMTTYSCVAGTEGAFVDEITLTTTPTTQSGYDLIDHRWFFSPLATPGKLVKIVSIQPISESRVRIVATDEDSAYYTAWGGTWTAASQTSLLTNARPEITNASILETLAMLTGSVIGTMVTINFSVSEPIDKVSGRWRIASGDWELFEVQLPTLEIRTLLTGLLEVEATPIKGLLNGTTVTYSQTIYGKTAAPATPQNLTATITDAGISLAWDKVTDLDLKEYQVYVNGTFTTTVTSPYWRWPHIPAGTTNFEVYSIDTSGNLSSAATASVTIAAPSAPSVAYSFSANQVMLSITPGSTQLSIDYYEVFYTSGETLVSLGKTYSTVFSTLGSWSGSRLFTVKAVDLGGNVSAGGTVSVAISPPSTPTLTTQVIDNNVLLYWTEASGSLPVATYEVRKGATWASAEVIGKKSGGFTTVFETQASTYTYWVAAIDTAGNYGTPASRTATVSQPPDYVLHMNQNSDFSGTKSNAVLDAGALLLPVNTTETFQEHFTTPDPDWATPQAQIDAGYPYYIQPGLSPGYYEETFDAGQVLPAMKVVLTLAGTTLVGTCVVTTRISLSETGSAWADYDGVSEVFGTNFRYAKIKVTVTASATGAIYSLTGLNIRLEAKLRNDAGSVQCLSTDTLGTYVNFAQRFTDVSSVTATPAGTSATTVAYDFHDALDTGLSYSVVSNVATISHTSQPFVTGQKVYLMVTSGGGVSGEYTVASTSANSYTVAMTCANTTGTLSSYPQSMRIYAFNPTTGARVSSGVSWSIKGY